MPITDLSTVKLVAGIAADDDSLDAKITRAITAVEGDYRQIRNEPFKTNDAGEIIYPGQSGADDWEDASWIAAEMVAFKLEIGVEGKGLKSEQIGKHSQSFEDKKAGYPESIVSAITKYAGAK